MEFMELTFCVLGMTAGSAVVSALAGPMLFD